MKSSRIQSIKRLLLACQVLPLVVGLISVVGLQLAIVNIEKDTEQEQLAREAIDTSLLVENKLTEVMMSLYLYSQLGDDRGLRGYYQTRENLQTFAVRLENLPGPADEKQAANNIAKLARRFSAVCDETIELMQLGSTDFAPLQLSELRTEAEMMVNDWSLTTAKFSDLVNAHSNSSPLSSVKFAGTLSAMLLGIMVLVFCSSLTTSRLLARHLLQRLQVLWENGERLIREQDELLAPLDGKDEIAQVDSALRKMSAAIQEASKREREILSSANAVILTCDEQLNITSASESTSELLHLSPASLVGTNLSDAMCSEEAAPKEALLNARNSTEPIVLECDFKMGDGGRFESSATIGYQSDSKTFSVLLHDVSARKASQRKLEESQRLLKLLFTRMPAGLLIVDEHGGVLQANENATSILGTGQFSNLGVKIPTWKQVEPGSTAFVELGTGAEKKYLEIGCAILKDAPAEQRLLSLIDVTERQQLQQLRQDLVATIIGDVSAPLASISTTLTNLKPDATEAQAARSKNYLSTAASETRRLMQLFAELLEVEDKHISQIELNKRATDLSTVVRNAAQAVSIQAEKRNIEIVANAAPTPVTADPDRLVQVLINLAFNALKFTPSGGKIRLSCDASDAGAVLLVEDNGKGIPAGMEQTIFEPFKQTSVNDCIKQGGSGLGLFICKSIVEKHGGQISAFNNESGGASFKISLPLQTG